MEKELVQYDFNGSTIVVEVNDKPSEEEEWERVAWYDHLRVIRAKVSFDTALNVIKPVTKAVMTQVESLETKPEKVEVGFGLTIKANGGAVIASAGIESTMNVKLTWNMGGTQK